jgi:hypothetical protein
MTRRNIDYERDLLAPSLSAMLREAYADDPALAPAPGRTERIMRAVKATGRRGVNMIWASFIWGAGATATAVLVIALMLGMSQVHVGKSGPEVADNDQKVKPRHKVQQQDNTTESQWQNLVAEHNNAVPPPIKKEQKQPPIKKFTDRQQPAWTEMPKDNPREEPKENIPVHDQDEVVVAAALYNVGTTSYHYGDYESAYTAFQDSYETMPTPEAALSTGNALEQMAREALADNGSEI